MPNNILNHDKLENLLAWLDVDKQLAAKKFLSLQLKLTKFFEWRGCYDFDECVDETIDNVADKVTSDFVILDASSNIVENKEAYLIGTARHVFNQWWKRKKKYSTTSIEISSELVDDESYHNTVYDDKEESEIVENCRINCLNKLRAENEADWRLLVQYYDKDNEQVSKIRRKRIATEFGKTPNALRIEICRIRQNLWRCVSKCVKSKYQ